MINFGTSNDCIYMGSSEMSVCVTGYKMVKNVVGHRNNVIQQYLPCNLTISSGI